MVICVTDCYICIRDKFSFHCKRCIQEHSLLSNLGFAPGFQRSCISYFSPLFWSLSYFFSPFSSKCLLFPTVLLCQVQFQNAMYCCESVHISCVIIKINRHGKICETLQEKSTCSVSDLLFPSTILLLSNLSSCICIPTFALLFSKGILDSLLLTTTSICTLTMMDN